MGQKLITVIEDSEEHSLIAKRILNSKGYHVIQVLDGEKAMESLMDFPPHLVLLDIMMPKVDGFQILEAMKKISYLSKVPVVMFSALKTKDKVKNAIELGAVDYVVKPINAKVLVQKVRRLLLEAQDKEEKLSVEMNPERDRSKAHVSAELRITDISEMEIILNSELYFLKGLPIQIEAGLFKDIGIEAPCLKARRNTLTLTGRFKCQNEFMFVGLKDIELQKIRHWVNSNKRKAKVIR